MTSGEGGATVQRSGGKKRGGYDRNVAHREYMREYMRRRRARLRAEGRG